MRWFLVIALVIILAVDIGVGLTVEKYEIYPYASNAQKEQYQHKTIEGPVIIGAKSAALWFLNFADDNDGAITALSTLVIALFTVVLAWANAGLLKAASKQADDMRKSLGIATKAANASALQAKAAIAAQIPVVAMGLQKLCELDSQGNNIRDPVTSGPVPDFCRPVFAFQNTGPTRILILYFAMKCEIAPNVSGEPHFGGMTPANLMLKQDEIYNFTTQDIFSISPDDRRRLDDGSATLWAYGFLIYNDFLDEAHQIGVCSKWDPKRGFVSVHRDKYSYHKHEKSYTKGFQI